MLLRSRILLPFFALIAIAVALSSCQGFFTKPILTSINVSPTNPNLAVNGTQQFTATGVNDDGSTSSLKPTWSSSNGNVIIDQNSGMATAKIVGTATITATSTGSTVVTGTTTATVNAAALTSITVSDSSGGMILTIGGSDTFHATAHFADNSTQDITSTATWTSSAPGVATITSPGGVATAVSGGTTGITASSGNVTSTSFTLTVL